MKNLPDDELFNALENRLRNYSDEPDEEVWNRVAAELSSSRERNWIVLVHRMAAVLFVSVLGFLFYSDQSSQAALADQTVLKQAHLEPGTIPTIDDHKRNLNRVNEKRAEINIDAGEADRAAELFRKIPAVRIQGFNSTDRATTSLDSSLMLNERLVYREVSNAVTDSTAVESSSKNILQESHLNQVNAQDEVPQKRRKRKSRATLYTLITPVLVFNHASPHSDDDVVIEKLHSPPVLSVDRFGISMEVGVQGTIRSRWQYLAGLSYYHQSYNIVYEQQSNNNAKLTSQDNMSYDILPGTAEKSFDYSMHNVGLQAGILYTLKQHGLYHKAGVVLQYQLGRMKASENTPYNNAASDYLNYQLLYRVEYRVNSRINVFLQPSFTHSLIVNESLRAPFDLKQSRAGIGIGIVYSF